MTDSRHSSQQAMVLPKALQEIVGPGDPPGRQKMLLGLLRFFRLI